MDFEGIKKSCAITVGDRKDSFSTRDDYLNLLKNNNVVKSWSEIQDKSNIAEEIYRNWQSQGQLACKFAQHMARTPDRYNLSTRVIKTDTLGKLNEGESESILKTFSDCVTHNTEALALLFPNVDTATSLVTLLSELSQLHGWKVNAKFNPSDLHKRYYVSVHVTVTDTSVAEALGFGPFDFLPFTRRAPLVAIELRTKSANPKKSSLPFPEIDRLHLAGVPFDGQEAIYRKKLASTEQTRANYLGGDDSAGKAKVAFAIPREIWEPKS